MMLAASLSSAAPAQNAAQDHSTILAVLGVILVGGLVQCWINRVTARRIDIIERLDDVAASLERLGTACSEMWTEVNSHWDLEKTSEVVEASARVALARHQEARASRARLKMRPHAKPEHVKLAEAAENELHEAIGLVFASLGRGEAPQGIGEHVERGYKLTQDYEARVGNDVHRPLVLRVKALLRNVKRLLPFSTT